MTAVNLPHPGHYYFPLMKSSIVTVSIMTYLNNWNEFMLAITYLSSKKWKTLPLPFWKLQGSIHPTTQFSLRVMALSAAPALIIYIILNKHITKGVALGAVKG